MEDSPWDRRGPSWMGAADAHDPVRRTVLGGSPGRALTGRSSMSRLAQSAVPMVLVAVSFSGDGVLGLGHFLAQPLDEFRIPGEVLAG